MPKLGFRFTTDGPTILRQSQKRAEGAASWRVGILRSSKNRPINLMFAVASVRVDGDEPFTFHENFAQQSK